MHSRHILNSKSSHKHFFSVISQEKDRGTQRIKLNFQDHVSMCRDKLLPHSQGSVLCLVQKRVILIQMFK